MLLQLYQPSKSIAFVPTDLPGPSREMALLEPINGGFHGKAMGKWQNLGEIPPKTINAHTFGPWLNHE